MDAVEVLFLGDVYRRLRPSGGLVGFGFGTPVSKKRGQAGQTRLVSMPTRVMGLGEGGVEAKVVGKRSRECLEEGDAEGDDVEDPFAAGAGGRIPALLILGSGKCSFSFELCEDGC